VQSIDELFACINEASLPLVKQRKAIYSLGDFITSLPQDRGTAEKNRPLSSHRQAIRV
jgi:hypothetical protein